MKVRPAALPVLLLLVGFALVLGFGGPSSRAHAQNCGAVDSDVFLALVSEAAVPVFISLQGPPDSTDQLSLGAWQANTAQRQAGVLADLTASDFTLGYQYTVVPALAGVLAASGAELLDCHPDVLKVDLDGELFGALPESGPSASLGDVNCDGGWPNSVDATLVLQFDAALLDSLPCQDVADPNGDGMINAIDAALILQREAGLACAPFSELCVSSPSGASAVR